MPPAASTSAPVPAPAITSSISLSRGERVDVQGCRGSWCRVSKPGPDGWVSANYLDAGGYYDDD